MVNGRRARIVGQGDPKTRDRPASENGISPLKVALYSGWRSVLGEIMYTPMTPWAEASWTLLLCMPENQSRGETAVAVCAALDIEHVLGPWQSTFLPSLPLVIDEHTS